jgi:hypothetical protein
VQLGAACPQRAASAGSSHSSGGGGAGGCTPGRTGRIRLVGGGSPAPSAVGQGTAASAAQSAGAAASGSGAGRVGLTEVAAACSAASAQKAAAETPGSSLAAEVCATGLLPALLQARASESYGWAGRLSQWTASGVPTAAPVNSAAGGCSSAALPSGVLCLWCMRGPCSWLAAAPTTERPATPGARASSASGDSSTAALPSWPSSASDPAQSMPPAA